MLLLPGSILATAAVLLTVALVVVGTEQKKERRLFLTRFRNWVDARFEALARRVRQVIHVIVISVVYVMHQMRAGLARAIAPQPRRRKQPQARLEFEKTGNHLSDMHDHKSDAALTTSQKKKLRNKKLEERF